jgi:hypothetical protein
MAVLRRTDSLCFILAIFAVTIGQINAFPPSARPVQRVPQLIGPLRNTIIMPERRPKTQKLSQTSDGTEDETEKKVYHDQLALTKLYRGVSMLHFGQIVMAVKKSGLSLGCLNVIGGPLMAFGVTFLLGNACDKQHLAMDTSKRLNGVLVLYATLALCLVALVPQLHNPFGMLWFISASSTLFVAVKGYFSGLKADSDKTFFPETLRLFSDASRTTLAVPPNGITFGDFFSLWTVAIRKASLVWGILQVLLSVGLEKSQIAPKLSQLAKLTLLGGSLVTAASIEGSAERDLTMMPLNMMTAYVFSTMAGK